MEKLVVYLLLSLSRVYVGHSFYPLQTKRKYIIVIEDMRRHLSISSGKVADLEMLEYVLDISDNPKAVEVIGELIDKLPADYLLFILQINIINFCIQSDWEINISRG